MDNVYHRLAAKLDEFPHGFPRTASGVELRILAKVFSPDDAAMALDLLPIPETAAAIARRLGKQVEELQPVLDGMVARGQIATVRYRGAHVYTLAPFVIGIYEFQLPHMDEELAEMFEEYAPTLVNTVGGEKPALARVVPVNAHIEARAEVLRHESVRTMMEGARSFRLIECICRKEQAALGKPCSHTLETCLAFSSEPDAYERFPYGRTVSREQALAVLDLAEREGLVHCTYNIRREQMFVCNCCSCCCGFLRGVREFGAPHLLLHSNYLAEISREGCIACDACTNGRCPMVAIAERDGTYAVNAERCIGCGACTLICPTNAISLVQRPRAERTTPPKDIVAWAFRRATNRSGLLRTIAQFGRLTARMVANKRAASRPE
jgi:Pyruvate/2-oxoacid:ferredoxin oxidoreductase delta subunit